MHAPVPASYAQRSHQFQMSMLSIYIFLPRNSSLLVISARISSWHKCSVLSARTSFWLALTSVPDEYAQHTCQFLSHMFSACISSLRTCGGILNEHIKNGKTDAHAEHACKELIRMVRVRISSWRTHSACASVPDPYAQRAHNGQSMRGRNSIFSIVFKIHKTAKTLNIAIDTNNTSNT